MSDNGRRRVGDKRGGLRGPASSPSRGSSGGDRHSWPDRPPRRYARGRHRRSHGRATRMAYHLPHLRRRVSDRHYAPLAIMGRRSAWSWRGAVPATRRSRAPGRGRGGGPRAVRRARRARRRPGPRPRRHARRHARWHAPRLGLLRALRARRLRSPRAGIAVGRRVTDDAFGAPARRSSNRARARSLPQGERERRSSGQMPVASRRGIAMDCIPIVFYWLYIWLGKH